MTRILKFISPIAFTLVIAGCGQMGPLYMPKQPNSNSVAETNNKAEQANKTSQSKNQETAAQAASQANQAGTSNTQ